MVVWSAWLKTAELDAETFMPDTTTRLLANRCMLPLAPKVFCQVIAEDGFQGLPVLVAKARPNAAESYQWPGTGVKLVTWANETLRCTACDAKVTLCELLLELLPQSPKKPESPPWVHEFETLELDCTEAELKDLLGAAFNCETSWE